VIKGIVDPRSLATYYNEKTEPGFAREEEKDKYLEIIDKTNVLFTVDNRGQKKYNAPNSKKLIIHTTAKK